ncbi:MAG: ATP-binding cassette domain-containing protein, partial [Acidimicrobiia bacterium]
MSVPGGVVLQGVVLGTGTGLLAVGLVLTYRATRAINFAYGAMGGVGATLGVGLYLGQGWPWPAAVAVAVAAGVVAGGLSERLVIRRFAGASRLHLTVATIGLAQVLGGISLLLPGWLGAPRLVGSFETALNDVRLSVHPVILTGNDLFLAAAVPFLLGALGWFLCRTDAGRAVRAIADNRDRAVLLGLPVARLSSLVWLIGGGLAALTVALKAPGEGLTVDAAAGVTLLLPALAAAMVAGLESLPVAFAAGVGLGVVDQVVRWNVPAASATTVVFLGVILLALVVSAARRRTTRVDPEASSWSGAGALRPLPGVLAGLPEMRAARSALRCVVVGAALAVGLTAGPSQLNRVSVAVVYGIVAVSLVVLSGWGGTVSLGQVAIVGVGAVVTGNLVARSNLDLFLALAAAAAAGAVVAVVVGLPALRVRGLYLAVTTLAFAVAVDAYALNPANFGEWIPGSFDRPVLWKRFDLGGERPFYFLCLGGLVLACALVRRLRASRTGRTLIATRDNQRAAAAAGIATVRTRLEGFVMAGALAGLAGGLHAMALRGIGFHTYEPSLSLLAFSMAVIGGIGSVTGALSGVALITWLGYAFPRLQLLLTGAALLAVLMVVPGGLAEAGQRLRDLLAYRVARRRGLDVTPAAAGSNAGTEPAPGRRKETGPTDDLLLRCRGIDARYGSLQVLFGTDLDVREGEMVALLGTNGSGKSTLLRVMSGLLEPTAGTVEFDGGAGRGHLAMVPGGRGVFPTLTVAENLRLACWPLRRDPEGAAAATTRMLAMFPALGDRSGVRAGDCSGGEQQMLSLAMALAVTPRLLCIDELSLGLAPAVVEELLDVVRHVHRHGTTVVVVEQSVSLAMRLAERAVFLEKGRVRFTGSTAELAARDDLVRAVFLPAGTPAPPSNSGGTSGGSGAALECRGIRRSFGGIVALDGVDLQAAPGEIVGLMGANGAGKTTLFDVLSGFLAPDAGHVVLSGTDVTTEPPHRRAVAGLGRSFQEARLYPSLTVAETIAVALERHFPNRDPLAAALTLPASTDPEAASAAAVDAVVDRLGLGAYRDTLTGELSTGTRRVVELACILALGADVVLLDEPSAGLAQSETEALVPLLRALRSDTGCTMVIIEHDVAFLTALCDRLVVMGSGAV